jgi:hypothetical protein
LSRPQQRVLISMQVGHSHLFPTLGFLLACHLFLKLGNLRPLLLAFCISVGQRLLQTSRPFSARPPTPGTQHQGQKGNCSSHNPEPAQINREIVIPFHKFYLFPITTWLLNALSLILLYLPALYIYNHHGRGRFETCPYLSRPDSTGLARWCIKDNIPQWKLSKIPLYRPLP